MVIGMHIIDDIDKNIRTDLIIEKDIGDYEVYNECFFDDIKVTRNDLEEVKYSTIMFDDITDKDNYYKVQKVLIEELKRYIKVCRDDKFLIIGLGNNKSTPDSLGPKTIDEILVTGYLFLLGEVEDGYSNVSVFSPGVMGTTGLETACIIKSIIKDTNVNKVIVVDALKTNKFERLTKTIQITNQGISPGSGIGNRRDEISQKTMGIDIIAIGVPTVIDISKDNNNSFIVTPTDIDFLIEKLSSLIGNSLNMLLHENFIRQNK